MPRVDLRLNDEAYRRIYELDQAGMLDQKTKNRLCWINEIPYTRLFLLEYPYWVRRNETVKARS